MKNNKPYVEWDEVKKELEEDFTNEDYEKVKFEMQIIEATIKARKKAKLTQQQLSELSGIKQPNIAKIEALTRVPRYTTLISLLYPMGYTLKVVPIKNFKK